MKEIKSSLTVTVLPKAVWSDTDRSLIEAARSAALTAYAPYSEFRVGAAVLLANGEVVTGSNQENAAYPSGLCAERVAAFYAAAQYPNVAIIALAIAAHHQEKWVENLSPCGACRQVLVECEQRHNQPMRLLLAGSNEVRVVESAAVLLPLSFNFPSV